MTVTDPNASYRKGFQLTATGGTFTGVASTLVSTRHKRAAIRFALDLGHHLHLRHWTPPASGDSVTVYVAGAACNGNAADQRVHGQLILSKADAAARPAIRAATGVVNGASYDAGISSGSWVTVFGSNLAPAGVAGRGRRRNWQAQIAHFT